MEKTKPKSKFELLMQRRPVQITFGLAALTLAYIFASLAIDSGSLLDYAITLLLLVLGLKELASAIWGKRRT